MKEILKLLAFVLLITAAVFVSCNKELSCYACNANKPPIANAGSDTTVTLPRDSTLLEGTASTDPDGTIVSYRWAKITGPVSANIITPGSSKKLVKSLVGGVYQFELTVTDNGGLSAKDTVQIIVDNPAVNQSPAANAGPDQAIKLPIDSVLLDGSKSIDPDNNITAYNWTKISGPSSFNIINANAVQTVAKGLVQGIYKFELKVTDAGGLFSKDTVQVIVNNSAVNQPPVACAGADITITLPANAVTLDGSCSADPDNDITSYSWSKIAGTSSYNIANANAVTTGVTALVQGVYEFEVKVVDAGGMSSNDTVQIIVDPQSVGCDNSNKPIINARLTEIGTLSKARIQIAVASAGTKIVFAGGRWTADCPDCWGSSRVDIYDTIAHKWSIAELSQGRFGIAAVTVGNKIFFAGGQWGDGGQDALYSTVDIYDAASNKWSVANLSEARGYIAAATVGDKVFFAGGGDGDDLRNPITTKVDIYNITSNEWSSTDLRSEARLGISAVSVNQKIYFAGGTTSSSGSNKIDVYDNVSQAWTRATLQAPMGSLAGITIQNKIYWAAGCSVEIKDANTGTSSTANLFQPGAWTIDDGANVVLKDNKLVFFRHFNSTNKFDIYDIATHMWSIGVLPQNNIDKSSIIAVNNTIYVAGGWTINGGNRNDKVWKLEF
jgi:hypothetical protein